jgi:hypothetical protein
MSYPKQDSVTKRLQAESMKSLYGLVDNQWREVDRMWRETRRDLRLHIMDTYRQHFGDRPWSLAGLQGSSGTQIFGGIATRLERFKAESKATAKNSLNGIYKNGILRYAWVLDQTTPPSYQVRVPYRMRLFEAGVIQVYSGEEAVRKWADRWDSWVDAYQGSLINNLRLGAINESNMQSSADEVDATRAGSPTADLLEALRRIFESEAISAISAAEDIVGTVNDGAMAEEIWQTVHDGDVCDICEPYDGFSADEIPDDIPAHPNCRCYWRIVPVAWAELLRSGGVDDRQLAIEMDARGLVPNSMAIRDERGNVVAYTIVDFMDWVGNAFPSIVGK